MTTLHGTDITVLRYDHSLKNAIKFGIEGSDVVTSVSKSLAEQTTDIIETDKTIIPIYNVVRENEFPTKHSMTTKSDIKLKACYGIEPEEKVIINVSNFRAVKRIDTVIETFAKIHQKLPSKLILLGDGPQLMDMKAKARELDIEDAVLF